MHAKISKMKSNHPFVGSLSKSMLVKNSTLQIDEVVIKIWKESQQMIGVDKYSWSSKSLLKVGREVLIKYVFQSIPTYFMSLFTLHVSLCDEIERRRNSFWWGHS